EENDVHAVVIVNKKRERLERKIVFKELRKSNKCVSESVSEGARSLLPSEKRQKEQDCAILIVLPEPNNDVNRHHRASSRGNTRIYDINPGVAGAALDPRKPWFRGAIPPPGITATTAPAGEPSFNSLCESRLGEDSLFSYGYGVQPREDTDASDEVLTRIRSGVMRDSEVKHSPGLFQYSEMPSLTRSTPPRAFGNITTEEDKNSVFKGYLTAILSCIYAIFILMLGVVVYIADLISRTATLAECDSLPWEDG
ncbi:hypothetical protein Ocin01_12014, partial [Orchesella cincta]